MGKKIVKENIRVEVELKIWAGLRPTEEQQIQDCEHMVAQIKRHVDDVGFCGVVWETEAVCEHCEYGWEVNEDPNDPDWGLGEPVCCVKAQKEWKEVENEEISMSSNED